MLGASVEPIAFVAPNAKRKFFIMNEFFHELIPNLIGLKDCPECNGKIQRDIFSLPKGENRNGGRLLEGRACHECKIIFEVLSD